MLRLFSKIRYKLAGENKFGKYLRYTIGKIVLVPIAIILALQINNWNENIKNGIYEKQILQTISFSLQRDSIHVERLKQRGISIETTIVNVLTFMQHGAVETHSDYINKLKQLSNNIKFNFEKGAYWRLTSGGLEYISNDSLRTLLVSIYEV